MLDVNFFDELRIGMATADDIRQWSHGEVKKPETINYRTYRPEKDGLMCEKIFGPEKDWECSCGKYRGMKYKGMICDRCGVKVTHSRVRRKRMGHINLAAPVVHIWFFKAMPSRLGTLLEMKTSDLEKVVYFQDYVVIDPGTTDLEFKQVLTEEEKNAAVDKHGPAAFTAMMGAEAVRDAFLAGRCGLVDPKAPCKCSRQVGNMAQQGLLDPNRLRYATHPAREALRTLEHYKDSAELFRSQPAYRAPDEFLTRMRELIDSRPMAPSTDA